MCRTKTGREDLELCEQMFIGARTQSMLRLLPPLALTLLRSSLGIMGGWRFKTRTEDSLFRMRQIVGKKMALTVPQLSLQL
jgi:hypothetical protein